MPTYSRLLEDIARLDTFPVEIAFITRWLERHQFQDRIRFIPVEMDKNKAAAYIKRYSGLVPPYKEQPWICDIVYSKQLNDCWRRFICCKELMHFFDRQDERITDSKSANLLINELTTTNTIQNRSKITNADVRAYEKALIALAPLHTVEQLRDAYENGKKSNRQIALFLKIPEFYIDSIFTDTYADAYTSWKHDTPLLKAHTS